MRLNTNLVLLFVLLLLMPSLASYAQSTTPASAKIQNKVPVATPLRPPNRVDVCKGTDGVFNFYMFDIGNLPNFPNVYVKTINNQSVSFGDMWANYNLNPDLGGIAFKQIGPQMGLGIEKININTSSEYIQVQSANDLGQIIGFKGAFPSGGSGESPFFYDGNTLHTLAYPSGPTLNYFPNKLNNKGQIIGTGYGFGSAKAVLWETANTEPIILSPGIGVDINNAGVAILNNGNSAYVINADKSPTPLPLFPGSISNVAMVIDDSGVIMGNSYKLTQPSKRPVMWKPVNGTYPTAIEINIFPSLDGETISLNKNNNNAILKFGADYYVYNILTGEYGKIPLPAGVNNFYPKAINDKCEIIGQSYTSIGNRSLKYIPL